MTRSPDSLIPTRPLLETKLRTTPGEFARLLRETGDVFWWEPDRFWVVAGHEPAMAVLKGTEFSADRSAFFMARLAGMPIEKIQNFLGVVQKMMVTSDPPQHTARRKLAAFGIADNVLEDFRPSVDRAVDELIEKVAGKPSFDLLTDIALPLPCTILADLFCIPPERRSDFYRWSNDMTQFFGGASEHIEEEAGRANVGAGSLREYFSELIRARRNNPQEDFLSHLLQNQESLGLDDSELISQAVMMLVAGSITTTDQICNNMYTLLTEGPGLDALVTDVTKLDAAMEEANRLDPAVNFVFRVARQDLTLGGASIPAGQLVFVSNHAANRDPKVFESPHEFRLDRPRNPHISYGFGIHYCLGAKLGRIQMSTLFQKLARTFPGLRLAKDQAPVRKQQSLAFSGFETLVLEHAVGRTGS